MSLPAAFQRLSLSIIAAQSAEQMALAASPIIAVLAMGVGAAEAELLSAAQTPPSLLLSLPARALLALPGPRSCWCRRSRRCRQCRKALISQSEQLLTLWIHDDDVGRRRQAQPVPHPLIQRIPV